jgi:DNA polymerase III subunit delta
MIVKYFDLKKNLKKNINLYLLYGSNSGLIEETIENVFKPDFSNNIYHYDESEIIANINEFRERAFNKSFFENEKLIIINRTTDKILNLIEEIIDKNIDDIKIILKSNILEKKSKLRNFFEKTSKGIVVPYYEDNFQTLLFLAQNFFKQKKIKISSQNINFIIERSKGDRINLKNELEKIANYSNKKLSIDFEEILKLSNLAENYNVSYLVDQCLAKNKKNTLNILNENNHSSEDNILIIKTFLYKLKRLKKLKIELENKKNIDNVISSYKPPIFWKDKDIIKQQLNIWSLNEIQMLIKNINNLELLIKKNSQISSIYTINNFILEKLEQPNN